MHSTQRPELSYEQYAQKAPHLTHSLLTVERTDPTGHVSTQVDL